MGFYIQDDFWEACEELPEKTQDEVFGSLVRLFFKRGATGYQGHFKGDVRRFPRSRFDSKEEIGCWQIEAESKRRSKRKQTWIKRKR